MPIYEFKCDYCGKTFEKLYYDYYTNITNCPYCQNEAHKIIISPPNFKLKGNHWAKDSYGLKDKK